MKRMGGFVSTSSYIELCSETRRITYGGRPGVYRLRRTLEEVGLLGGGTGSYVGIVTGIKAFILPFLLNVCLILENRAALNTLFDVIRLSGTFMGPVLVLLRREGGFSAAEPVIRGIDRFLGSTRGGGPSKLIVRSRLSLSKVDISEGNHGLLRGVEVSVVEKRGVTIANPSNSNGSALVGLLISSSTSVNEVSGVVLSKGPISTTSVSSLFTCSDRCPIILTSAL